MAKGDHIVNTGVKHVDASGERIYFKGPYFDKAARRVFKTVEEKAHFLNSRKFVSAGDSDAKVKKERKQAYEKKMDMKSRMI